MKKIIIFISINLCFIFAQNYEEELNSIHNQTITTSKTKYIKRLHEIADKLQKKNLSQDKNQFYLWLYAKTQIIDIEFIETYTEEKNSDFLFTKIEKLNDEIDNIYSKYSFIKHDPINSKIMFLYGKNFLYLLFLKKKFINYGIYMNAIEFLLKYSIEHDKKNMNSYLYISLFYMIIGDIRLKTKGRYGMIYYKVQSILKTVYNNGNENEIFIADVISVYLYHSKNNLILKKKKLKSIQEKYPNSRYIKLINTIIKRII